MKHPAAAHKRHTKPSGKTVQRHSRSVTIQLTTTTSMVQVLDLVVRTGFFGNSRAAAAERLLSEAIRDQLKQGTIQRQRKAFAQEEA
jgi:hypothetical protein